MTWHLARLTMTTEATTTEPTTTTTAGPTPIDVGAAVAQVKAERARRNENYAAATAAKEAETPAEPAAPPVTEERKAALTRELDELAAKGREKRTARRAAAEEAAKVKHLETERAKLERQRADLERAAKDPLRFLEQVGVPPEEAARMLTQQLSPERQRARLEQAERARREQAEAQQRAQQERAEAQHRYVASQSDFADRVTKRDASKYPNLNALYEPKEILANAVAIVNQVRAVDPTSYYEDEDIAAELERQATEKVEQLRAKMAAQAAKRPDRASLKKLPRAKQNAALAAMLTKKAP